MAACLQPEVGGQCLSQLKARIDGGRTAPEAIEVQTVASTAAISRAFSSAGRARRVCESLPANASAALGDEGSKTGGRGRVTAAGNIQWNERPDL